MYHFKYTYQEKKLIKKELLKWSYKLSEYLGIESMLEYLLKSEKYMKLNENYQNCVNKMKEMNVYGYNEEEDVYFGSDDMNEATCKDDDQSYNEVYYDDDYSSQFKENQNDDQPLDLSVSNNTSKQESSYKFSPIEERKASFCSTQNSNGQIIKPQAMTLVPNTVLPPPPSLTSTPATPPITTTTTTTTTTRRNYSKEELDKALADIQSGRIGTRRASVLYGIPRSTLRNKVFRLNSQKALNNNSNSTPKTDSKDTSSPLRKQIKTEPQATTIQPDSQQQLQFETSENQETRDKIMSALCMQLTYERLFPSKMNYIDTNEQQLLNYLNNLSQLTTSTTYMQQYLNTVMNNVLNNTIQTKLQTINNQQLPSINKSNKPTSQTIETPHKHQKTLSNSSTINLHQPTLNQHNTNTSRDKITVTNNCLKQKRAKRGQYRKYESDQLSKAVEAVINGQMSVHKAGSHFGVPHSTLEYKVKERNSKSSSNNTSTSNANQNEQQPPSVPPSTEKPKSSSAKPIQTLTNQNIANDLLNNLFLLNNNNNNNTTNTNDFSASQLLRQFHEHLINTNKQLSSQASFI